jgi:hypothetical protein
MINKGLQQIIKLAFLTNKKESYQKGSYQKRSYQEGSYQNRVLPK